MSVAYLLTGSNLGHRWQNISDALSSIGRMAGEITAFSPVYESPAWGFDHPRSFLNQAIRLKTGFTPTELLMLLIEIEKQMGRERHAEGYEARNIDIDILLYDDLVMESPELTLPHPRLHLRRFAMLPLMDIDNTLVHPVFSRSIRNILSECPDKSEVNLYEYHKYEDADGGSNAL